MTSDSSTPSPSPTIAQPSLPSSVNPAPSPTPSLTNSAAPDVQVQSTMFAEAPLRALLAQFPRGFSTVEEGQRYVQQLQTLRQNAPAFRAVMAKESEIIATKVPRSKKPSAADALMASLKSQGLI